MDNANILGLVELFLVFGAVIAFGAWELWSLRRDKTQDERQSRSESNDHLP